MLKREAGDILRHARWAKGWTIEKLAEEADVAPNTIVKIEKGELNVRGQKIYALAAKLDIDAPDLFAEAEAAS